MKKAIAYALFGYEKGRYDGCFSFDSYLSGLLLSIRMNRLVYPGWENYVVTDESTFRAYENVFNALEQNGSITLELAGSNAELCEAMLWRMKPLFTKDVKGDFKYDYVLCRDLDSLSTYREAQAVQMWINNGKAAHAITDSVSHTIPMLGGMIGFVPGSFRTRINVPSYEDLMRSCRFDLSKKGADQRFLNSFIYPKYSPMGNDSITQHYFKGHATTWLADFHTCDCWLYKSRAGHNDDCPLNIDVDGVPRSMEETNEVAEHIGAAGYNQQHTMRIMNTYKDRFQDLEQIEDSYPEIFYWRKR